MPAPILTTTRLRLRIWEDRDLEPFARLNADPRVMEHLPALLSRDQSDRMAARTKARMEESDFGLWAAEVPGVSGFIGYVGLAVPAFEAHFTPGTEIGWRLAHEYWGKGYATEAATAVLAYAFDTLQIEEVVSFTVPKNLKSIRVMERIGMSRSPEDDFLHPALPDGHPLKSHVLYRLRRDERSKQIAYCPAGTGRCNT